MGNWWDAATQNMPSASYGQSPQASQPQGTSIFGNQPMNNWSPSVDPAASYGNFSRPQQRPMPQSPNANMFFGQTGGGDPGNGQTSQMHVLNWGQQPQQQFQQPGFVPYQMNTGAGVPYGQSQQPQQPQMQPGQGQNQLMQLLQQIMQQRGGGQQQPQGPQYPGRPTPWNDIVMQQGQGGQYSYPGAQQGQPPATNLGMAVDPQLMQRIMTQRQAQQQSGLPYWSDTMSGTPQSGYSNSPGEQWRYQQPQQPPSGMSQQMPAFIQQFMQQRMQQQQMQPQGGQYQQGGGMNTGMGMQQQQNPFLQMLMQMQQRQQPQTGGMTTGMGGY